MPAWTTCPHCGLSHSVRADGACPRCRRAPQSPAPAAPAPSARAAPPGTAPPAAAAAVATVAEQVAPAARKPLSAASIAASAVGAIIGVGASRYFGASLILPGAFGIATAVALTKLGPQRARPLVPAVSVLVGHLGWMLAFAIFTGTFAPVAIDVVLMAAGAAWLVARPGLAPVLAVALLEVLAAAFNGWQLASAADAATRKALALHLLLRVGVLAFLALGYLRLRKDARARSTAVLAQTFE